MPNILTVHFSGHNPKPVALNHSETNEKRRSLRRLSFHPETNENRRRLSILPVTNENRRRLSTQLERRRQSLSNFNILPVKDRLLDYMHNPDFYDFEEVRERIREQEKLYQVVKKRRSIQKMEQSLYVKGKRGKSITTNRKVISILNNEDRIQRLHERKNSQNMLLSLRNISKNSSLSQLAYPKFWISFLYHFCVSVWNFFTFFFNLPNGLLFLVIMFVVIGLAILVSFIQLLN